MVKIVNQYRKNKAGIHYRVRYALPSRGLENSFFNYLINNLEEFNKRYDIIPCMYFKDNEFQSTEDATIFRFGNRTSDKKILSKLEDITEKKFRSYMDDDGRLFKDVKIEYFTPFDKDRW